MRFQEHQLTEYRRHTPRCGRDASDLKNCKCPLWAQGRIHGKPFRRSLATRSLQQARKKIQTLLDERPGAKRDEPAPDAPAISAAIADHLTFVERNLRRKKSTLISYQGTFKAFAAFCAERRFRSVDEMNLSLFEQYQAAPVAPLYVAQASVSM